MSFYESPVFVDLLLWLIYVLLAAVLGLSIWSVVRSHRLRDHHSRENGVPAARIVWGVVVLFVVTMGLSWLLASTEPVVVNGRLFDSVFWLRISDMLIYSSAVLMLAAVGCVLYGMSGLSRKRGSHKYLF